MMSVDILFQGLCRGLGNMADWLQEGIKCFEVKNYLIRVHMQVHTYTKRLKNEQSASLSKA